MTAQDRTYGFSMVLRRFLHETANMYFEPNAGELAYVNAGSGYSYRFLPNVADGAGTVYYLGSYNNLSNTTQRLFQLNNWIYEKFGVLNNGQIISAATNANTLISENVLPTVGAGNVIIGYAAGQGNVNGVQNTYVGRQSGYGVAANDNSYNTGLGYYSVQAITTGTFNTGIGVYALGALTTATNTTAIGNSAGSSVTTGSNNTFIGASAGAGITTGAGNIFIGYNTSVGNVSNNIVIADGTGNNRYRWDGTAHNFYGSGILLPASSSLSFGSTYNTYGIRDNAGTIEYKHNGGTWTAFSSGGSGGVTSITGTTNQITASASTGSVTLSLPSAVTISGAMSAGGFYSSTYDVFSTANLNTSAVFGSFRNTGGYAYIGKEGSTAGNFTGSSAYATIISDVNYPIEILQANQKALSVTATGIKTLSPSGFSATEWRLGNDPSYFSWASGTASTVVSGTVTLSALATAYNDLVSKYNALYNTLLTSGKMLTVTVNGTVYRIPTISNSWQ
jgi:hypothetical protein